MHCSVRHEMADIFSLEAHVRGMLAFEAALARAEARAGIIPQEAANIITNSCRERCVRCCSIVS